MHMLYSHIIGRLYKTPTLCSKTSSNVLL